MSTLVSKAAARPCADPSDAIHSRLRRRRHPDRGSGRCRVWRPPRSRQCGCCRDSSRGYGWDHRRRRDRPRPNGWAARRGRRRHRCGRPSEVRRRRLRPHGGCSRTWTRRRRWRACSLLSGGSSQYPQHPRSPPEHEVPSHATAASDDGSRTLHRPRAPTKREHCTDSRARSDTGNRQTPGHKPERRASSHEVSPPGTRSPWMANGETEIKCERRDLNPHPRRDRDLNPARLPFPPRSRAVSVARGERPNDQS